MYHKRKDTLLKRNMQVGGISAGQYYVLVSDHLLCSFTHIIEETIGSYEAESLYVHHSPKQFYFHHYFGAFHLGRKITASVFRQALSLYEKCKDEILSMEFAKEQLLGIDKACQYFYLNDSSGNVMFFGNLVTDNDKEMMDVVEIDMAKDIVTRNIIPVSDIEPNLICYRIDSKTYSKAQKLHDMINHSLATLLVSCLK